MSDDTSDPKIVDRLSKLPPYDEEQSQPENEIIENEDTNEEVEVKDEPKEEVTEDEALQNSKNPERTKKYIDKLKEEVQVEKKKNILDSLVTPIPSVEAPQYPEPPITNKIPQSQQYPGLSQTQVSETFKGLVDENGYVDSGLLVNTLKGLQEQAKTANERAQKAEEENKQRGRKFDDFERNQIMREVHKEYPKLDPENEEFDERLWKFVRNEVIDQWMNGKPTDVMSAAREGSDTLYGNMKKAEKEQIVKTEEAKKNINALGNKQASSRDTYSDQNELVKATQLGKKGALAERLARSGY